MPTLRTRLLIDRSRASILLPIAILIFAISACKKPKELPPISEYPSAIGIPGAIAWKDGLLFAQALEAKGVKSMRFDRKKNELVVQENNGGIVCLLDVDRFDHWGVGCDPALDIDPSGVNFLFLGRMGSSEINKPEIGGAIAPPVEPVPKGAIAFAVAPTGTYYLTHDGIVAPGQTWSSKVLPFLPPSVGLVARGKELYTVALGTGQILRLEQTAVNEWRITGRSPIITPLPYGLAYDDKNDVFWVSGPLHAKFYRVSPNAIAPGRIADEKSALAIDKVIDANQSWTGEITIDGNVTIPKGVKLLVEAGASIKSGPSGRITVEGELDIAGTYENPVTLAPKTDGDTWGGLRVAPGGRIKITGAKIYGSVDGVEAVDPQYVSIEKSVIQGVLDNGVELTLGSSPPEAVVIEGNRIASVGGATIHITPGAAGTAPSGTKISIANNLLTESGSGIVISPTVVRPFEERIKDVDPKPFATPQPMTIAISINSLKRNLYGSIYISGDGLDYPISATVDGNMLDKPSYMTNAVILHEVAFFGARNNCFKRVPVAIDVRNVVVNFREGAGMPSDFDISGNYLGSEAIGIFFNSKTQYFRFIDNYFPQTELPMQTLPLLADSIVPRENRLRAYLDGNYFAIDAAALYNSIDYNDPYNIVDKPTLVSISSNSRAAAVVECEITSGSARALAPGVEAEIRDKNGVVVKKAISNAASGFVVAIPAGEYFAKAGKAAQWTKISASNTDANYCDLNIP